MMMAHAASRGLITTLFLQRDEVKKELNTLVKSLKDLGKISYSLSEKEASRYQLHPTLVRSLILQGEGKYLDYAANDSCRFFALIEQKLLKSSLDSSEFLPFQDNGGNDILFKKKDFIKFIYKKRCPLQTKLSRRFSKDKFQETLKELKLETPESIKECKSIIDKWKASDELPFICAVPHKILRGDKAAKYVNTNKKLSLSVSSKLNERIREGNFYKSKLSTFQRQYFANMCQGIGHLDSFCTSYTTKDYWALALSGKVSKVNMEILCKDYFKKPFEFKLTQTHLQKCSQVFRKKPETCMMLGSSIRPSLFPRENCHQISDAFLSGRVHIKTRDCPGMISNAHITNAHRLSRYLIDEVKKQPLSKRKESCHTQSYSDLYQIYSKAQQSDMWPIEVCYNDKIEGKEVCHSYLPGPVKNSPLSEERVITGILFKMGKIDKSVQCLITNQSSYNPVLVQYKTGCHIINERFCFHTQCKKRIIVDEKPIKEVTYKGQMLFDYFPKSWQEQRKSFKSLLSERFGQRQTSLKNFTQLSTFFTSTKKGIVHGLGCLEDLLPEYFERRVINQCTTHSFIIDGILTQNGLKKVILRSSYDDLRSPRQLSWNQVFNAVMNQQSSHPLRQWNLYGLKK